MDDRRFDALTRALSGTTPRRQALRLLGGGFLGSLLAGFGSSAAAQETTATACRRVKRPCDRDRDCCSRICKHGTCRCRPGHPGCDSPGLCPAASGDVPCSGTVPCNAAGSNFCFCGATTEGPAACIENATFCANPIPCTDSTDCDAGKLCVKVEDCCGPALTRTCLQPCLNPAT